MMNYLNFIKQKKIELNFTSDSLLTDYAMSKEIFTRNDRRVAIFGGGAIRQGTIYYEKARFFAKAVASEHISIITGGGPGIMEAGNRGACASESKKSVSYGIRVKAITDEMIRNPFLQKNYEFDTLSLRLLSLISSCDVAVLFPGGFGTLEELFSLLVRIKVNMLSKIPVYLFGESFWKGLIDWMKKELIAEEVINDCDFDSFQIVDDINNLSKKVITHIKNLT